MCCHDLTTGFVAVQLMRRVENMYVVEAVVSNEGQLLFRFLGLAEKISQELFGALKDTQRVKDTAE